MFELYARCILLYYIVEITKYKLMEVFESLLVKFYQKPLFWVADILFIPIKKDNIIYNIQNMHIDDENPDIPETWPILSSVVSFSKRHFIFQQISFFF